MASRSTPAWLSKKPSLIERQIPALPFPVEVLPQPLARLVREVAKALPCPPDFMAVPMLALLGCAIGTSRVLRVKPGWLEGARIFAAVVAEPGTKKSPALKLAAWPFYERQRTLLRSSNWPIQISQRIGAALSLNWTVMEHAWP
jgi:hypothetical protein